MSCGLVIAEQICHVHTCLHGKPYLVANSNKRLWVRMKIKITGYVQFRAFIGDQVFLALESKKTTLRDTLHILCEKYGKKFEEMLWDTRTEKIRRANLVMLNSHPYMNLRDGLDSELKEGDEITIIPMLTGG